MTTVRDPGEQEIPEQHSHLVATQHAPTAAFGRRGDRHGQSIRIRVVGNNQIRTDSPRLRDSKIECTRFLRIRFGHSREIWIRIALLPHHARRGKPSPFERGKQYLAAHTMKRRVHHPDVASLRRRQSSDDRLEIVADNPITDRLAKVTHPDLSQRPDLIDSGRDFAVGGRNDLGPISQKDLISVVLSGVVTRGDHHSCRTTETAHRKRKHRGWEPTRKAQHPQPRTGNHPRGLVGKAPRAMPSVAADHHTCSRRPGHRCRQVSGKSSASPSHRSHVHPRRAGAEGAAEPSSTKMQTASEPVRKLTVRIGIKKSAQFRSAPSVRIIRDPRLNDLDQTAAIRSRLGGRARGRTHRHNDPRSTVISRLSADARWTDRGPRAARVSERRTTEL